MIPLPSDISWVKSFRDLLRATPLTHFLRAVQVHVSHFLFDSEDVKLILVIEGFLAVQIGLIDYGHRAALDSVHCRFLLVSGPSLAAYFRVVKQATAMLIATLPAHYLGHL